MIEYVQVRDTLHWSFLAELSRHSWGEGQGARGKGHLASGNGQGATGKGCREEGEQRVGKAGEAESTAEEAAWVHLARNSVTL